MRCRWSVALAAVALGLGGCGSHVGINGKVIPGAVSFIGTVDSTDERLKQDGLEGVNVSARSESGPTAGMSLGSAKTDKKGNFILPVRDQRSVLYPARFSASKAGYIDAHQSMTAPAAGSAVLVIMKENPAPGGGG
jgi:hypothetical protein